MKYNLTFDEPTKTPFRFKDLNEGDIFFDKDTGNFFMKIEEHFDEYNAIINAIFLSSGECACVGSSDEVERYTGSFEFKSSAFKKYWEDLSE